MEKAAKIFRGETESFELNILASCSKVALSAALAWKILPCIPRPRVAAPIVATVSTLFIVPLPNDAKMYFLGNLWDDDMDEQIIDPLYDAGLISIFAGVQAAALVRGFSSLASVWQSSRPMGAALAGVLGWSALEFVSIKGGVAGINQLRD